ncbi:biotin-dependent carboxyltransferase family protein [Methylocapsa acidiphila]|uniref:5-oxoprolinase subunit C family protein n=1 Tax=Methylocapsa acidiphila TaxID=133552 RepID=UPI000423D364|nr:biotin-dependent carboxyltransferase family protein [Methylocapsa acidiphila]
MSDLAEPAVQDPAAPRLRVLRAGPCATIQDGGRFGYLRYGVTPAGPMDWAAFRTANLALDQDDNAAAIEISYGGFELLCEGAPTWIAFAGGGFSWRRDHAALPPATRVLLRPGDRLSAQAGSFGAWTYLAVEGGIETPPAMGSRATHVRSAMGGLDGRMLRAGDLLPARPTAKRDPAFFEAAIEAPWLEKNGRPLRVVLGPQDDYFTADGLAAFFCSEYRLTPSADRMAYRLDGPEIPHARGHDIVSDGIALGAIQIAGDRKPLILMADRQPTGGYPKLGHVIGADIGRLAQMRPGEACRFTAVSVAEARAALLDVEEDVAETPSRLHILRPALTSETLLGINLIDGFVDALKDPGPYLSGCDQ